MPQLYDFINQLAPKMTEWRRDFHLHAESGWLEFRTASKVAEVLDGLGYQLPLGRDVIDADSRMGLPDEETLAQAFQRARAQGAPERWLPAFEGGFAGVVATLDTGRPGPTLAFRVDMDALDLNELHDDSHRPHRDRFASCNDGMMHACGHDGHTAIGLGLAHVLKEYAAQLNGTIKLIFQPAEEGTRGARAMVTAGVLDDVDYFTAIHIGTGVPSGTVVCGGDNFMATTKFDVLFSGVAAHAGGKPEDGRNALLAAAQAALALHAIAPHSAGASRVNVGVMQAGTGRNVVPSSARLKVETRGETDVINQYVFERAKQAIAGAATMYEARYQLQLMGAATSSAPSPAWVDYLRQQTAQVPGVKQAVDRIAAPAGSEDATLMMARVQERGGLASYMIFGTELSAGHHNEKFDFDENVMTLAVETLARVALNFPWQRGV
ncbi:M20 family metallo-hydrolase [Klebsiella michiganensis]|uniref:M20 family metallo-hydrolase n=1 Tax=Klebsiella michiganensis TaxID=1134687 RepID=UPI00259983ED|nr:M20 family metallo-hydrolase [Klebsiella michiganensis]MDM4530120.1 M20 family metallo-hydrolase [Klebsiella michiganensis]MDM4541199.1 M20 family metallo-hydrolase [Klebsiella michiganensis]HBK4602285.1 M20 family metallo-hydrolase [Klebsiella michiganensis]HBK4636283.1 M20 family metallo-hydrolase [Klebsiella michiganensis]HBK4759703.1 M20 family metallo-hydrolase [Klebsiella michiganensis]